MEKSVYFISILLSCVFLKSIVASQTTDNARLIVKGIVANVSDYGIKKWKEPFIIGGENVTIQDIPYLARLVITKTNFVSRCGGSIISEDYILTAAHCLPGARSIIARVGSTYSSTGGTVYRASHFVVHPLFDATNFDYDVAIIQLNTAMAINDVDTRIVSLAEPRTAVEPGTDITVAGWGAIVENGTSVDYLRAVVVPVVSNTECSESYGHIITDRLFCAGVREGGKDACEGDSGGPAVSDDEIQVGIVSSGFGCGRPGIPGIYTNVSSVREWIAELTGV